jgi:hypothetical protein
MTVTALQAGSPAIAVNQIVTGYNLVPPRGTVVRITSQLTGTAGGVGTYQTTYLNAVGLTGLYACLQTTDNTAVWDFGTEYFAQYHSAFWVAANKTGGVAGNVGTAYGVNTSIYNAAFDCSLCTFTSNAAAVRIGPNQFIDFSAQGTSTTQNLRVLYYSTYAGANTLVYGNPAGNCMEILDNGAFKTLKNTLDDGNGNITPAGAVGTTFAGVTATGTTGATAAATTTQYIWVNGGSGGIKLPATLGVIVTVYNALSTSLVVYSNDGTQTRETLTAGSRARYYTAANNNALLA